MAAQEACEELCECVQVVVTEDTETALAGPGESSMGLRAVQAVGLTEELIRSIAQAETVYYVQPDGTLLPRGGILQQSSPSVTEITPPPAPITPNLTSGEQTDTTNPPVTAAQLRQSVPQTTPASVSRLFNHKHLKSICVQVPGLGSTTTKEVSTVCSSQSADSENMNTTQSLQVDGPSKQDPPTNLPHNATSDSSVQAHPENLSSHSQPEIVTIDQEAIAGPVISNQDVEQKYSDHSPSNDRVTETLQSCTSDKSAKEDPKAKKSLKIKTRSGRISRPPKHKAKDYKFIKMGDLAFGHASDSDDYSELSVEDDDVKETGCFDSQNYNLKPKLFRCESCEKAYIGRGGLSRHYKFFPDHGSLEGLDQKIVCGKKANGDTPSKISEETGSPRASAPASNYVATNKAPSTPQEDDTVLLSSNEQDSTINTVENIANQQESIKSNPSTLPNGKGEEKAATKTPRRRGRTRAPETIIEKHKRPKKILRSLSPEEHELQRRDELREVEQDYPNEPTFPRVYSEFEQLHCMVKGQAQDYLRNKLHCIDKSMFIKQKKVAESLGFPEEFIKKHKPIARSLATSISSAAEKLLNSLKKPRHSTQELVPPAKKLRTDNTEDLSTEENGSYQETFDEAKGEQNEGLRCESDKISVTTSEEGHFLVNVSNNEIVELHCAGPLHGGEHLANNIIQDVEAQIPSSASIFYHPETRSSESLQTICSTTVPENTSNSTDIITLHKVIDNNRTEIHAELPGCLLLPSETPKYVCQISSEPSKPEHNIEISEQSGSISDIHIAHKEVEKTFTAGMTWDHTYRACNDETQISTVQESALSTTVDCVDAKGDLDNQYMDVSANTIEVSGESHNLLTQANEQIFFQTADGILLPHSALAGISQQDSFVILTDSGAMHFETVEALLQM
ncbi:zinc finger protein 839 isoform X2 [Bombina bombina]|uniref:zinc finger protein 839 isoform X2 n=1 Tax=Bombina bombina TaxID=8345 RepID=UPI00235A7585|nr:zinc finger protein 839 isoform X2 [Bombina bombina]